jgi:hypothetical protein
MNHGFQNGTNSAAFRDAAMNPAAPRQRVPREWQVAAEQRIEWRLRRLGDEIRSLTEAPYPGLLQDRSGVGEALDELMSRHTTLLWTARVAKCTEGAVREHLWRNIERAIASLERVAGSLAQN